MIRPAALADLAVLQALEQACFPDAWSAESLTAELAAGHQFALLATDDAGQVVGSLLGWLLGDELQINRVAVWPELRQRGIGHLLVRTALRRAEGRGATRALLEVRRDNAAAIGLYRQQGFTSAGVRRAYYHDGCDALVLTKEAPLLAEPLQSERLQRGLYALVDGDRLGVGAHPTAADVALLVDYMLAAANAGAVAVQLRVKQAPLGHPSRPAALMEAAARLTTQTLLVVDDDVAAIEALPPSLRRQFGVHLGQHDLPVSQARDRLGSDVWIGLSTHTLRQVAAARNTTANYLGFGPVHNTASKQNPETTTGLFALSCAAAAIDRPVVAIGGLTAADLPALVASGVHAAAVLGAWLGPQAAPRSPTQAGAALAELCDAWRRAADIDAA